MPHPDPSDGIPTYSDEELREREAKGLSILTPEEELDFQQTHFVLTPKARNQIARERKLAKRKQIAACVIAFCILAAGGVVAVWLLT